MARVVVLDRALPRRLRGRGYSVAALDLRGHGQSPPRGRLKTTRITDYVADVAVPPRGVIGVTLDIARHRFGHFAKANATWSLLPLVSDPEVARHMFYSEHLEALTALGYASRVQDEAHLAFLDMLVLNRPKPKRVSAPMLVLGDKLDVIFPPKDTAAAARAYGTEPIMFDAAHNLMLEPGWPEVAQAVSDWLNRLPA